MTRAFVVTVLLSGTLVATLPLGIAEGAGKMTYYPSKKVIELIPFKDLKIELPDQNFYNFGENFHAHLSGHLDRTGKYVVVTPQAQTERRRPGIMSLKEGREGAPEYVWNESYTPAATVKINVRALSFITGRRGEQMFYGFDERQRNFFSDGTGVTGNEFPLRQNSKEAGWFDGFFDKKGSGPVNSRTGLDLGDAFKLDVLFAWLNVKYVRYHSELHMEVDIEAPVARRQVHKFIRVQGDGYYYDVAGAYEGYSGGIRIARKDAMEQAFRDAIEGSMSLIEHTLEGLPLTGRIDSVRPESEGSKLLLGTGYLARIAPGTRYELSDHPGVIVEVIADGDRGSIGKVVCGDRALAQAGKLIRQARGIGQCPTQEVVAQSVEFEPASAENIAPPLDTVTLPWKNFHKTDFKGTVDEMSRGEAFLKGVVETALLPYRIWRYFQYDQKYGKKPDPAGQAKVNTEWAEEVAREDWAWSIGLRNAPRLDADDLKNRPIVAVIDSGVDYNHPVIRDSIWRNPRPTPDPLQRMDHFGWDFISGDARPYDDGYHGTEVVSGVLAVAPHARILPLKVFNSWGVTNSAAIYGAFTYAVDHGAKIIVCAWATRVPSIAIELGVAYARDHGVLVVAAAGDRGEDLAQVPAYPASLSTQYENVLTVAAVGTGDRLMNRGKRKSNFGAEVVGIAAPGVKIRTAFPRDSEDSETSTAMAAALVAGAAARINLPTAIETIFKLKKDALKVAPLRDAVREGLRLRILP